jgi:DNA polymerase-1
LLNVEDWENELNEYKKKHRIQNYKLIPKEILYPYAARDVVYTWHIYEKLKHAKTEFPNLYHKEIKPMSILVEKQRGLGIRIDMQKIEEVHQILEDEEISLQTKIRVASDSKVKNPRSTLQVRNFLFKELKLPPVKATLGGEDSTDRETIDILTEDYPDVEFLQLLKDHRDVSRIRSSYIEKIRDMAAFVGRIHPDFRLAGTLTGRLSDSLLLLLPRRQKNKYSAYVRSLFIADPGYVFFYADFDQKELRVLACEAQEPLYKMIFESGDDPHSQLADLLYGPEWRQKPNAKEWRTWAKNTNYADKYGGGLKKLAKTAHTTISRVKQALASYEAVELWKKEIYNQVLTKGYLQTHFERRRRYEFITKRTWPEIQRQAVNFMIQSTANSINFHCALKIDQLPNVHVLMTQHDSIQALIPEDHLELAEEAIQIMKHLPGQIYSTYVPFNAEMGLGHSWAEAEEKT